MNDKLIMEDYLLILKSTVEVYVHGTLESSNTNVRKVLKNGLDSIMDSQNQTYHLISKNGWYKVNNVNNDIILNTLDNIVNGN